MSADAPKTFLLDGKEIPFSPGQTVMQAALDAGVYVPHLCSHPEFKPHGSCKLCTVKVNGCATASCTFPAREDLVVESEVPEIRELRKGLVQFLFVEGNHFCPSCEKSGDCALQAIGYSLEVMSPHFTQLFPDRPIDASHPDLLLDFNRCILCELCVRASGEVDGKHVFALSGRGIDKHLIVNSESGKLADTSIAVTDMAAGVCPVGVILKKRRGFAVPIGQRRFDQAPIDAPPAKKEGAP
jgi:[NiFe] hydrogenase diaphorase moiety small subunit